MNLAGSKGSTPPCESLSTLSALRALKACIALRLQDLATYTLHRTRLCFLKVVGVTQQPSLQIEMLYNELYCNLPRCARSVAECYFVTPNTTHLIPFTCRLLNRLLRFVSSAAELPPVFAYPQTTQTAHEPLLATLGQVHYPLPYRFVSWF